MSSDSPSMMANEYSAKPLQAHENMNFRPPTVHG
jgi:hypothetical protein